MNAGWTLLAAAAVGSAPFAYGQSGYYSSPGMPSGYPTASYGEVTSSGVSGGYGDQLYPYEAQEPWLHGYFQEIPAYGGYHSFRPYNYKHVLSQSQTAAGFGMSPVMPYSQQFWHRYENQANFSPYANEPGAMMMPPAPVAPMGYAQPLPGVGMSVPATMSMPAMRSMPAMMPAPAAAAPGMASAPARMPSVPAAPSASAAVQPAEWNAGPTIVPAKAEDRAGDGKGRWGRWSETNLR